LILVDTSVLVDFLSGTDSAPARYLERLVAEEAAFYLTPLVVQEVLQGARDEAEWRALRTYLGSQMSVTARDPLRSHVEAARIYFDCRRRGLTIRSTIDCLIAQIALEHGFALLHDDRDFEAIRRVRKLRTLP
jgi:hypothetical protein